MGFLSTLLGVVGFGVGVPLGLLLGYFIFIYSESSDVKDPVTRKIHDLDSKTLKQLLPEIPLWVKRPDYERVDWMNKFIAELWPWLDKAACDMIRSMAKPIFDQYIGKFHIKSIEFGLLTLGTLPPRLHGVNFYETNGRELILETDIRWAGNPNVLVVVNFLGFRVTVQLIDSQIFMSLRVTLKPLVPTFPCFGSVGMSLTDKPHVDFGLKLVGADIMAIPILYSFAQETIKEQLGDLCLWPQTLKVPILDGFSAMKKPVGILHVKVQRASGLLKMDLLGKSDPYVKLSLSGERLPSKKTTVKMCELNPEWNERFKLVVRDPETQVLELHVFDWEKMKAHDKLGMQVVPLSLLNPNEPNCFTLDLLKNLNPNDPHNRRRRGKITVELRLALFKEEVDPCPSRWLDGEWEGWSSGERSLVDARSHSDGVLSVAVVRAGNVEGKHHNNTYAVVAFKGEQRKTKMISRSREPRWDEEFQFMLEEPPSTRRSTSSSSLTSLLVAVAGVIGPRGRQSRGCGEQRRINETYNLINSRRGVIHVDIKWRTV
ncbi:unnamed protein product [Spirodela intermedia]|uniref:Uncharacterized protein n=1 Tax=Spirodela intermedia TaxID=51605 RepID=A0A7I8IY12_SPIIN|nr:unnamed protein product [Spirodela intermedia]CAA6662463.1 unnamed protein product [Spirodela intermedia]